MLASTFPNGLYSLLQNKAVWVELKPGWKPPCKGFNWSLEDWSLGRMT